MTWKSRLAGLFTDSDVGMFYISQREKAKPGSFIREVGDFIAHQTRDKGVAFESSIYQFSQFEFCRSYQFNGSEKIFPTDGPCPWWLRSYIKQKLDRSDPQLLKRETGLRKNDVGRKLLEWFDDFDERNNPHPTKVKGDEQYYLVVRHFSKQFVGEAVFQWSSVREEILDSLVSCGVAKPNLSKFMAATAVLLHAEKRVNLHQNVYARIALRVVDCKLLDANTMQPVPNDWIGLKDTIFSPEGRLRLDLHVPFVTDSGQEKFLLVPFLETEIDTAGLIDSALLERQVQSGLIKYNLEKPLAFSNGERPYIIAGA